MEEPLNTIVLILTLIVMLVGVIGIVLPIIPGTILIFVAALIYALIERFQAVGWPTLVVLGFLAAVATSADIWASSVGARMSGASGWSVIVGLVAGLAGFVVFSLPGAIFGAILGVLLTEIIRVGDWRQALKAGSGWLLGWVLSTVVQLVIGLIMVAIFVWQVAEGA
ncbi:MAG TPA: DUF456 domain-containing protein [Anaerolineae bacterium]|nr:DUF456 domain-containing protein [Anaerolineae bacterium]